MSRDIPTPGELSAQRGPLDRARAYQFLRQHRNAASRDVAADAGLDHGQVERTLALLGLPTPIRYGFTVGHITEVEAHALLELGGDWYILHAYEELRTRPHSPDDLAELIERMKSLQESATIIRQKDNEIDEALVQMAHFGGLLLNASLEERQGVIAQGIDQEGIDFCIALHKAPDRAARMRISLDRILARMPERSEELESADELSEA